MRADGHTYATIALERGCSLDEVKQMIDDVTKVIRLRLIHEAGGGVDGPPDGGPAVSGT